MSHTARQGLRNWIEIDRKAIAYNFKVFRGLIPKRTKLMAVVKSNAYGHGLVDFAQEVERLGADFLGVDSMTEALALRRQGITIPILVLGYTLPELIAEAAEKNISLTVSSFEALEAIQKARLPKPLKVHIKVDTGMHRQGFLLIQQKTLLSKLKTQTAKIKVEGLFTHFAAAKNPAFPKDTQNQVAEFTQWIGAFKKAGLTPILHAAATAGTLLFPETHFDMVRIGIGLYGYWPAQEVKAYLKDRLTLMPLLVWKSLITEIKSLKKGSRVGYDLTETLTSDSRVAVVPIGYWHGYPRSLSSIGRVVVRGSECRVLGRVSMDMLTIDTTNVPNARVGNVVEIILDETTASLADSSVYELITRLNPLIKRLYH